MDMVKDAGGPPAVGRDWRAAAACLDEDPDLFFPVGSTGPALRQIEQAKTVCRTCRVMDTCREWALEAGTATEYGVWGGLDEAELRALKRRNGRERTAAFVAAFAAEAAEAAEVAA